MSDLDQKAVKSMIASLQRQRNSALDRVVDLETAYDGKQDQLLETSANLQTAYADLDATRNANSELTNQVNRLLAFLTDASALPAGFTILKNGADFAIAKVDIPLESPGVSAVMIDDSVKIANDGGFEDATVEKPKLHHRK